jgi:hypothetical protein
VGQQFQVLHSCAVATWDGKPGTHAAKVAVDAVVRLKDGGWRAEANRCDGSRIHLIFNAKGVEVGA